MGLARTHLTPSLAGLAGATNGGARLSAWKPGRNHHSTEAQVEPIQGADSDKFGAAAGGPPHCHQSQGKRNTMNAVLRLSLLSAKGLKLISAAACGPASGQQSNFRRHCNHRGVLSILINKWGSFCNFSQPQSLFARCCPLDMAPCRLRYSNPILCEEQGQELKGYCMKAIAC